PCRTAGRASSRGECEPPDAVACEGRAAAPATLARLVCEDRAHGGARGALGDQRKILLAPRGAGDVEVRPRQVPGERLEEEPGVDRATAARSDVVQIGDLALEVLAVLVDQRELPEPLARQLPRVEQPLRERLVVGHEAGAERAERDNA